ncbi:glutamate receptor-like [Mizuhopecten yessoensis]|uniref:Glutamate receptor n=1 Tax=Mizuhopecten yessoensis TaxID=6573 RepID=A0A210R5C5_MIZYE|nr:glutamate receptor-like [Mizuhopecten yessoensis]OWF56229.1 Glutamate receptor [Mizuhopecten yessoensis]
MKLLVLLCVICVIGSFVSAKAQGATYKVITLLSPPWVMERDGRSTEGFMIDLLKRVSRISDFNYTLAYVKDGNYGSEVGGNWNGAIGELIAGDAQIAALPMITTEKRQTVVDFSSPIINSGHRILIKKPVTHNDPLKVLFEPYSLPVWILVMVISWIMGAVLIVINKFSPSEWGQLPEDEDPTHSRNSFTANNAFFFVHSTLTWQGYKEVPKSPAGRIVVCMWFSFIFFMIIAYTANLAALLLARGPNQPLVPFKTFHEMAAQTLTPYGTRQNVHLINKLSVSNDPVYRKILAYMNLIDNNFQDIGGAMKKIRDSPKGYAAIVESTEADYIASKNCDLMVVGETIAISQIGFACSKATTGLCNELSEAIREIREAGDMYLLYKKWFKKGQCTETDLDDYVSREETAKITARPLSLADLSLAFIVLLFGLIVGAILLVVEILVHRYKKKKGSRNMEPVRMTAANGRGQSETDVNDESDKAPIAAAEP